MNTQRPITDFVYDHPPLTKGVKLTDPVQLEMKPMSLSDFDYRPPPPVKLDEAYYREKHPGLPDNAYWAMAQASLGKKAKQIRSEYKKTVRKAITIERNPKILQW